ncbi:hypothetical protein STXM2123_1581 [Streptomyces sp. F-3]|nr:hypothetical protein STXM2123_1581 [Streptomyces sp. F-3]
MLHRMDARHHMSARTTAHGTRPHTVRGRARGTPAYDARPCTAVHGRARKPRTRKPYDGKSVENT